MKIDDYIKIEQTKAIYKNVNLIVFGSSFVTLATFLMFWSGDFSRENLLWWLGSAAVLFIFRWITSRGFDSNKLQLKDYRFWLNLSLFWSFLGGVHWGMIPLFFLSDEVTVYTIFSSFIFTGYSASAISTNTAYPPAFMAFSFPASMFFAGRFIYQGDEFNLAIGFMIVFFFVVSCMLSLKAQQIFREGREFNFKNMALMGELTVQKEAAEAATLSKDQFLAAASHDLRQPLHSAGLLLSALDQYVEGSEGKELLSDLRQSNQALNHSFNSLLDVSRLDAGVVEAHHQHLNLQEMLAPLERDYTLEAKNKSLVLSFDSTTEAVFSDPILLERVLQNLISNAINYTLSGSIHVHVKAVNKDTVRILIKDSGIGIPSNKLTEIFSEYFQIDNPERDRNKGFGLGLAIVRRLCEKLRAHLYVSSEPSVGTTFAVYLPAGDPTLAESRPEQQRSLVDLSGTVVLLIDDDAGVRKSMHRLLSTWGCIVLLAESEEQAIDLIVATETNLSLIIADYRLREEKTGIQAINRIEDELNTVVPSIIVTGDTSPDRLQELTSSGFVVLHKPVSAALLRSAIQKRLSHNQ